MPQKLPIDNVAKVGSGFAITITGDLWCWNAGSFDDPEKSPL